MMMNNTFFNKDAEILAKSLLGKVICFNINGVYRKARIIETEAYYKNEKASHAFLGYTRKRRALFMPPGTIYMYHSRGGESFNISAKGEGNAVLIKSGIAFLDNDENVINAMIEDNPIVNRRTCEVRPRLQEYLCSGQTLLCKSLRLKIADWDAKNFQKNLFFIEDIGYKPSKICCGKRRGIPSGRDEDLFLRFYDEAFKKYITK